MNPESITKCELGGGILVGTLVGTKLVQTKIRFVLKPSLA